MDYSFHLELLRQADAEISKAILGDDLGAQPPVRKLTTAQALVSVFLVARQRLGAHQADPSMRNGEAAQRWAGVVTVINDAIHAIAGPSGKFHFGRNCVQIDGRAEPVTLCIGWLEAIRDPYNALGSAAWSVADALRILRAMAPRPDPVMAPFSPRVSGTWNRGF